MAKLVTYKPPMDAKYSPPAPVPQQRLQDLEPKIVAGDNNNAGTVNIYTCPANKRARLTFYHWAANSTNTTSQIQIAGVVLVQVDSGATSNRTGSQFFGYYEGPVMYSGQILRIVNSAGFSGGFQASFIIIEEDLSRFA